MPSSHYPLTLGHKNRLESSYIFVSWHQVVKTGGSIIIIITIIIILGLSAMVLVSHYSQTRTIIDVWWFSPLETALQH